MFYVSPPPHVKDREWAVGEEDFAVPSTPSFKKKKKKKEGQSHPMLERRSPKRPSVSLSQAHLRNSINISQAAQWASVRETSVESNKIKKEKRKKAWQYWIYKQDKDANKVRLT